jgi:tetratricopeptide (TPR) repeat protein
MALAVGCTRSPEARKAKYLAAGKVQLEKKDYERALLEFRNASQVDAKDAEPHYQAALAYIGMGDWGNAATQLLKATELNPKHAKAQLKLSEFMAGAPNLALVDEANKRLKALLTDEPDDPDVLTTLAVTEWRLTNKQDAEEHLRQAFEKFPGHLNTAVNLAQVQLLAGDAASAEATLKTAAAQLPLSAESIAALGAFYASQKRLPEADREFRHAIQVDPSSGAALLNLASLQVHMGKPDEADAYYRRLSLLSDKQYRHLYGIYLLQSGKNAAAVTEFDRLWKLDPTDRQARSRYLLALAAAGREKQAEDILNQALKKNPRDIFALLQRSEMQLQAGNHVDAQKGLEEVIHFHADSANAHFLLARVYEQRGDTLLRKQELAEALRLKPEFLNARLQLAEMLTASNAAQSALKTLNEAPEFQRDLPNVITARNVALIATGDLVQARKGVDAGLSKARTSDLLRQDAALKIQARSYDEARKSVREALSLKPDDVAALRLLVQTYVFQGQGPGAIKELQELSRNSRSPVVQNFLGEVLLETGDLAQARAAYSAAETGDPNYIEPEISLVKVAFAEKKLDEAQQRLERLIARVPRRPLPYIWMGHLQVAKGNPTKAMEQYRKALDLDANTVPALNNLAYLLADVSKTTDEALKLAEKAVELEPGNPDNHDTLGWVLYQKNLYSAAVRQLETAAQKSRKPLILYHLAMAYSQNGDGQRAQTQLEAALKLNPNMPEAAEAKRIVKIGMAK